MNPKVISTYDPNFVLLSLAIAFVGSFIALSAARRIVNAKGQVDVIDLISATLGLGGIGVWTMHFIGMLALHLDVRVGYSMTETIVSLFVVCIATGFALTYVARAPSSWSRLLTAGAILGLGVGVMHYLGMYGMRFGGYIGWSIPIVAASLLIAVVAATAALWLAFNTSSLAIRLVAAAVMAVAVCAMHYTGMSAADFVCTTDQRQLLPGGFGIISATELPKIVLLVSVGIALVLSIDLTVQRIFATKKQHA